MTRPLELRFEASVPAAALRGALAAALLLMPSRRLCSDNVSMATYYPAPSGVYTQAESTQQAWLARDQGYVDVGATGNAGQTATLGVMGAMAVGTSSPADLVQVNSTGSGGLLIGGPSPTLTFLASGQGPGTFSNFGASADLNPGAGRLVLQSGGGAAGVVVSGGRVGIGEAAPAAALDVNGTISQAPAVGNLTHYLGSAAPVSVCPAGQYASWTPGLLTYSQYATAQTDDGSGYLFCGPCPPGGCL